MCWAIEIKLFVLFTTFSKSTDASSTTVLMGVSGLLVNTSFSIWYHLYYELTYCFYYMS